MFEPRDGCVAQMQTSGKQNHGRIDGGPEFPDYGNCHVAATGPAARDKVSLRHLGGAHGVRVLPYRGYGMILRSTLDFTNGCDTVWAPVVRTRRTTEEMYATSNPASRI